LLGGRIGIERRSIRSLKLWLWVTARSCFSSSGERGPVWPGKEPANRAASLRKERNEKYDASVAQKTCVLLEGIPSKESHLGSVVCRQPGWLVLIPMIFRYGWGKFSQQRTGKLGCLARHRSSSAAKAANGGGVGTGE
jgi:hypothetical protein